MDLNMMRATLHGLAPHGDEDARTHSYGANWLFMKEYLSDQGLERQYADAIGLLLTDGYKAYVKGALEMSVRMELSARASAQPCKGER